MDSVEKSTPRTTRAVKANSFNLKKSDETLSLAIDLAKFIKDNKLSTIVQGKDFVNVEGWQYAGSRLGIVPIVEEVVNVSTETELKYQAKVTLFDLNNNKTVGAGFAVCSNKENGKKFYQEFAIMSMAQTRAIGKAYRNILAWIIRAAGYEPTPSEELEYAGNEPATSAAVVEEQPVPVVVQAAPIVEPGITNQQMEDITRLLNHPLIERKEKTKMLINLNRFTEAQAVKSIENLKLTIEQRESQRPVTGPTPEQIAQAEEEQKQALRELIDFVTDNDSVLAKADYRRFTELYGSNADKLVPTKKLQEALAEAQALVAKKPEPAVEPEPAAPASQPQVPSATPAPSNTPAPSEKASEATIKQIIQTLTSHHIEEGERSKMLLSLNSLTEDRAQEAIAKAERTIAQRAFCAYANEHAAVIGKEEHERAMTRCKSLTASADDFREELGWLDALVNNKKLAA